MRLYLRSPDRKPDPAPLATNERRFVWTVTAVWLVLAALAALMADRLISDGRGWWVWTPLVGALLGPIGIRWLASQGR